MPLSAIGTSAAASLVTAAISRAGSMTFQRLLRLKRVDGAVKNAPNTTPAVRQALKDFETVIGGYHGKLTVTLKTFLDELERGGLINIMCEQAITQSQTSEVRSLFNTLYIRYFPEEAQKSEDLYSVISEALFVSLHEAFNDKSAGFALSAFGKRISDHLSKIEGHLSQLAQKSSEKKINLVALQENIARVSRAIQNQNKHIRIETNKGSKLIEINKIYIPSKLSYRGSKDIQSPFFELSRRPVTRRERRKYRLDDQTEIQLRAPFTYSEFRTSFRRVVVLGDPGGGKSTLCQYLCHEMAKNSNLRFQFPTNSHIEPGTERIPIRVVLRTFENARNAQPSLTLLEFIIREIKDLAPLDNDEIRDVIIYALTYGRAILAFDGLDEILATSKRREFVTLVTSFADQFPLCPVLVTSRVVGYEDASLPSEYEELLLERFDKSEIELYATKFLRVVGSLNSGEAASQAQDFIEQTERNASDLRQNPLLLGLMCFLFWMKGDVPSNRPEIYKECAMLMFERWDDKRSIKADIPGDFDLLNLFSQLSSKIYGNTQLEEGVSRNWLTNMVQDYFLKLYEDRSKAIAASRSVVEFITGRSWVMSEVGPETYRFTHRTFLEFFYARFIDESYETITELMTVLKPKILNGEWEVISHLSLQIKTYRNHKRTEQALDGLRSLIALRLKARARENAIIFSSQALEYLPGTELAVKNLITEIYSNAFRIAEYGRDRALRTIIHCAEGSLERREFCEHLVLNLLLSSLRSSNLKEMSIAATLMSPVLTTRNLNSYFMQHDDGPLPDKLGTQALRHVSEFVRARAATDVFFAKLNWEWYGALDPSVFVKYGLTFIPYDYRSWPQAQYGLLIGIISYIYDDGTIDRIDRTSKKRLDQLIVMLGKMINTIRPARLSEINIQTRSTIQVPIGVLEQFLMHASARNVDFFAGALLVLMLWYDLQQRSMKASKKITNWRRSRSRVCRVIDKVLKDYTAHDIFRFYSLWRTGDWCWVE